MLRLFVVDAWIGGTGRIPAERPNYSAAGFLFGFDVGVLDDLREPLVFGLPELPEIRRRLAQDDRHAPILEALYYIRLLHRLLRDLEELIDDRPRCALRYVNALP